MLVINIQRKVDQRKRISTTIIFLFIGHRICRGLHVQSTLYFIQSNNRLKRIKTNQEQLGQSKHARQRGDSGCIGIR